MLIKKISDVFILLLCIISVCFLLIYPAYCIEAAKDGLSTSLYIVLPSIFPFMVVARFIVSSGIYRVISYFIGKPFEYVFGISRQYASAFVLGCLGGYPVGAIVLNDLLKRDEISAKSVSYLTGICNNASPMFVIGTVGTLLLNNAFYGYVLYVIQIFCILLSGLIMKFLFRPDKSGIMNQRHLHSFSPFSEAVTSSGVNMVNIASYIIIFSVISKFITLLSEGNGCSGLLCLLEITTGIKHTASSTLPEIIKLSLISFALGFSGLCVFLQIKSVFYDSDISFSKYFFAKVLTGVLSFVTSFFVFSIIFSH